MVSENIEKTLVMIKPEVACDEGKQVLVHDFFLTRDLEIEVLGSFVATEEFVREFYGQYVDKDFFPNLVEQFAGHRVIMWELSGKDAIERVREYIGPYALDERRKPENSWKLRTCLMNEESPNHRNGIHSSDSPKAAATERAIADKYIKAA